MQESISDFSQLRDENKEIDRVTNLIPIPGAGQVRAHHSIPAAPRHNIGNLDRVRQ